MVSPGNVHTSYIVQSEQVVLKTIFEYTYTSITTNNEKEVMDLKKRKEGAQKNLEGEKEREKEYDFIIISKLKESTPSMPVENLECWRFRPLCYVSRNHILL